MAPATLLPFFHREVETGLGEPSESQAERRRLAHELLADYLAEFDAAGHHFPWHIRPGDLATGRKLLAAESSAPIAVLVLALTRLVQRIESREHGIDVWALRGLIPQLCRRHLPFQADDMLRLLTALPSSRATWSCWSPVLSIVKGVDKWVKDNGLPEPIRNELQRLQIAGEAFATHADERKALALIGSMLAEPEPDADPFDPLDDWGYSASAAFARLDDDERAAWRDLLAHAATARGAKPSAHWLKHAQERIDAIGWERSREILTACLGFLRASARPGFDVTSLPPSRLDIMGHVVPTSILSAQNGDLLRGLAWYCSLFADPATASALGDAAGACFKKIPNVGARSTKGGNACVYALGAMPGLHGVAQLQRLRQRIKQSSALKQVDAALEAAARRERMTRDDLDDLAVPTVALVGGRRRERFGNYAADIVVAATQLVDIQWYGPDGTARKSEPAEVKHQFPEEIRTFKRQADDLRKMLPAQRDRIERFFMAERTWSLGDWRERYLDHPLLSILTRRLIWQFATGDRSVLGAWHDGAIVDVDDRVHNELDDETRVHLWHPINADAATVEAWQNWLDRHAVTQPFKQAHREVYVLTDAERLTETYSNRFAGHVLRQHQLQALCQTRGWTYRLQGAWEGANSPTLQIPSRNLTVEFWVENTEDDDRNRSYAGVSLYVVSDQVQFACLDRRGRPIPLREIPPVVFSEVMRDVDVFVAVCSVGNDPTWADRGDARYPDYRSSFAFGELSASARTRRIVLQRLIPRLKIAPRCALADNFLVVRGDLRTYKIHLGSGNILMEPNNQYLCIVPSRGSAAKDPAQGLLLPFEGDGILSIILSKAFMLADDKGITDPTIKRQIAR